MDKPGVRQVPEGNGEQGKMEKKKLVAKSSVVPTTLAVKGLMMIMMMMTGVFGWAEGVTFAPVNCANL